MTIGNVTVNRNSRDSKKRAFTLTEIAIVLGIIGLILGAIWVAASAVYNNLRVSHANTQILQLAQGIRSLYSSSSTTAGLTVDNLICAKAVPSDMIIAACGTPGTLDDAFAGGVTTVLPTTDGFGFQISMTGASRSNCDALLIQAAGLSRDAGLFYAEGSNSVPAAMATGAPSTLLDSASVTPTAADAAAASNFGGCSAVGNTVATQVVTFGFSLK